MAMAILQSVSPALLLLVVVALTAGRSVQGHGGPLHPWVLGDATHNFLRYPLAFCPAAAFLPTTYGGTGEDSSIPGVLPVFNTDASATQALAGYINVWLYLDSNCTDVPTTALSTDLSASDVATAEPYANGTMYTYGMNAPCSASSNDLYRNNLTLGDDRFNLMWTNAGQADASGLFLGTAVNAFLAHGPSEAATYPSTLMSLLYMPNPNAGPILCCDLTWNPPPTAAFFAQGSYCRTPAPSPMPPPSPPKARSPPPKAAKKPPPPVKKIKCKTPPTAAKHTSG